MAEDCFNVFNSNREHTKLIDVVCLSISLVGGTEEVRVFIESNFNNLASCILEKIQSNKDFDLIKSFAELCGMTTKKVSPLPLINCPELKTIIMLFSEFLAQTSENDANTQIIFVLHDLVCNPNSDVRR